MFEQLVPQEELRDIAVGRRYNFTLIENEFVSGHGDGNFLRAIVRYEPTGQCYAIGFWQAHGKADGNYHQPKPVHKEQRKFFFWAED